MRCCDTSQVRRFSMRLCLLFSFLLHAFVFLLIGLVESRGPAALQESHSNALREANSSPARNSFILYFADSDRMRHREHETSVENTMLRTRLGPIQPRKARARLVPIAKTFAVPVAIMEKDRQDLFAHVLWPRKPSIFPPGHSVRTALRPMTAEMAISPALRRKKLVLFTKKLHDETAGAIEVTVKHEGKVCFRYSCVGRP